MWQMEKPVADDGRRRTRFVHDVHRREIPPVRVGGGDFHETRFDHQAKEKPANREDREWMWWRVDAESWPESARGKRNAEERCFDDQPVDLRGGETSPCRYEGHEERPAEKQ
jgi:hypothetical protein